MSRQAGTKAQHPILHATWTRCPERHICTCCCPHRGALRGAVAPVAMPALVKDLGIEGLASLNALVPSQVEELVAEGAVMRDGQGVSWQWAGPHGHLARMDARRCDGGWLVWWGQ